MDILSLATRNGQQVVEYCSKLIKQGKVIISPTDTVYGLVADASNKKAVNAVYHIKRRDKSLFLPLFVKNMAMAKKIAKISKSNEALLEEKWPGKFTAVLSRNTDMKLFGVDKNSAALRIPNYPFLNSLLETLNIPLTATSANISGQIALTKIDEVIKQFGDKAIKPDLIVNAGDLTPSKTSTIVDLRQNHPIILRP